MTPGRQLEATRIIDLSLKTAETLILPHQSLFLIFKPQRYHVCASYNNSMTPICFLFKALWETKQTFLCYMGVDSACISVLSGGKDFQCSWLVKMIRLATLSMKAVTMSQIYAERISP